ncbi:putative mitochondrial RNA editing complex protein MP61 [Leptomonas pyrrhocoris]|uniref:Putative mitochondrial RNA editing complex protein MP61 n=1 Tax=Leptomonas pyrrhocoris TaxID=157538 RepID=A0A0M9G108_LEPPY|nr:putative mitochondrial RNA editing complex protein MP61 [Leptomonas pyrrhocoris]XP_015658427.1 putative mitochondrial RNA editing complex protein MP61 [Leptomonas pyrrhocoris]KPA79987.1 putative mitochondrial RNA editing complex protein MP61 [Leptomonas pyrrhocoris]KPA79988.1 putative mitochondrial RNA editing complex protein MP61 [Leptomonas pyrrhocoris]|eukprot:XP_015658426.1 putative mitochondrial RNA editing complex protein MP61 [Leptomonas pyrrhocoris]
MPSLRRPRLTAARTELSSHYNVMRSRRTLLLSTTSMSIAMRSIGSAESSSSSSSNRKDAKGTATPQYFNFATRDEFLRRQGGFSSRGGRRSRRRSSGPAEEEQILRNSIQASSATDPHSTPSVFRKDIAVYGSAGKQLSGVSVSVDVPTSRFLDMFSEFDTKRCKLCNETFIVWHAHSCGIPHAGREGILLELVRPFCGTPEEQVHRWNQRLYHSTAFGRIPALSHPNNQVRKQKLKYLLLYLKDREVLRDVFSVRSNESNEAMRGFEFERLEFIGDGVVKYILNNVQNIVFPIVEGGSRGRLANFQFVIDGNEGLARGYDYLELQDLTLSSRVVSKFKSDVVETLFGELQFYLWSTQLDVDTEPLTFPFTKDMYTLRALVQHVMYETATVLFMFHVECILGSLQRVVREQQLQFVRADPSLLKMQSRSADSHRPTRSSYDDEFFGDDGYYGGGGRNGGGGGGGSLMIPAPTTTLMKQRIARTHLQGGSAATFLESTNYENYKRVVSIGGLLPRPFTREQLAVIPNYMPHIQRDEAMTQQLRDANTSWRAQLNNELTEDAAKSASTPEEEWSADGGGTEAAAYHLSPTPTRKDTPAQAPLSVPRLKDEELIAELP